MSRFERLNDEGDQEYQARLSRTALVASVSGERLPEEVGELLESSAEPFEQRVTEARLAFEQGEDAAVAYLLGE